jgi:hypothetical protein
MIKKYIFPIILLIALAIGNILCYKYNRRGLHLTTNLVMIFLIGINFIKPKL